MKFNESMGNLFTTLRSRLGHRPTIKQWVVATSIVAALLLAANGVMAWYYHDHYYPNLKAGEVKVGNLTPARARQVITDRVDRQPLVLSFQDRIVKIPATDLGVSYNLDQIMSQLNQHPKTAFPLLFWLRNTEESQYPLRFTIKDEAKFTQRIETLIKDHTTQPQDAKLEINNGQAKISTDRAGAEFSLEIVRKAVESGLELLASKPQIVPFKEVAVKVTDDDLQVALEQANQKLKTKITLTYKDKQYSPTRTEIGSWLVVDEQQQLTISEAAVARYIEQVAEEIDVAAKNEVVTTLDGVETGRQSGESGQGLNRVDTSQVILQALNKHEALDYQLKVDTIEPIVEYVRKYSFSGLSYSYCVRANAVSDDMLGHFSQKISTTLADSRGWGMDGRIIFNQAASGCSFNLILAAASTLPGYSSGCSIYWSCRVGSNVIINVDRWVGASDSWNQAGGSLDEYQSMVINHEVGHWLGFDHWSCGGAGQPAPLMLQQSIDLQGCKFNAWPTPAELQTLRSYKGV